MFYYISKKTNISNLLDARNTFRGLLNFLFLRTFSSKLRRRNRLQFNAKSAPMTKIVTTSRERMYIECLVFVDTNCHRYFSAPNIKDHLSIDPPKIVVCADKMSSALEIREVLTHEMIHAFDHCVRRRDLTAVSELACSEIRAAREAECKASFDDGLGEVCGILGIDPSQNIRKTNGLSRLENICQWYQKRCVRRCAGKSIRPLFPDTADTAINSMFESCFRDHEPEI